MVSHLYRSIKENESGEEQFRVSTSYVQVYNERVYDLLHPSSTDRALSLRESRKEGGVYCAGATDVRAHSASELLELLAFGRQRLHFAETRMNRHSSRSHAVCIVTVQRTVGAKAAPAASGDSQGEGSQRAVPVLPGASECGEAPTGSISAIEAAADEAEERAAADRALSMAIERGKGSEVAVSARLTLVDLAGSERIKRTGAVGCRSAIARVTRLAARVS